MSTREHAHGEARWATPPRGKATRTAGTRLNGRGVRGATTPGSSFHWCTLEHEPRRSERVGTDDVVPITTPRRTASPPRGHRVTVLLLFALTVVGALLAGCTSAPSPRTGQQGEAPTPEAPAPRITTNPAQGAVSVSPTAPVTVTVTDGTLERVSMTNPAGEQVDGELAPDRTSWTAAEPLGYDSTYTISSTAAGADGTPMTRTSSFTTLTPRAIAYPSMNPVDGQTVGVGQPLAVYFSEAIEDKQAAEDAITIKTEPAVEGAFYWFSDTEVHWRPQEFWEPGTKVTMDIDVYGKDLGNGVYGETDRHATFTIGDAKIARADGASHQMTVEINGEVVRTIPISMGEPEFPSNNGVHVVTQQHQSYEMDSSTYGLAPDEGGYVTTVQYATRISNGGEFVHAAPWSVGAQGERNVSHGCINMSTDNARWFYNTFGKGDVVIQTNTGGPQLEPWDGFGDWQVPWEQWLAGGAS
ncbi:MAG: L,D-transpeptidase family protein [Pseudonocardiaceae bacterium]|nr:L,D-transpeptidase family protein [Pseudonocardiaceae bacterium]